MASFQDELDFNVFRDIFTDIESRLVNDEVAVEVYRGEFLQLEAIKDLANRFSSKSAFLVDIEDVAPISKAADNRSYRCNVTIVLYAAYPEYRDEGEGVKGSFSLALWGSRRLAGQRLAAGTDHAESSYELSEIVKEDQIPFLSVHALRMAMDIVIDFNTPI